MVLLYWWFNWFEPVHSTLSLNNLKNEDWVLALWWAKMIFPSRELLCVHKKYFIYWDWEYNVCCVLPKVLNRDKFILTKALTLVFWQRLEEISSIDYCYIMKLNGSLIGTGSMKLYLGKKAHEVRAFALVLAKSRAWEFSKSLCLLRCARSDWSS